MLNATILLQRKNQGGVPMPFRIHSQDINEHQLAELIKFIHSIHEQFDIIIDLTHTSTKTASKEPVEYKFKEPQEPEI